MAEKDVNEAELGRSKQSITPREHLMHLLNIGWNPRSPLVTKYAVEHGLTRDLEIAAREMQETIKK
jgi:hypothetical protein